MTITFRTLTRTGLAVLVTATATACAVTSMGPASAVAARVLDPSAYGLSASGPHPVAAHPAVDWTQGAPQAAWSGPLNAQGVHLDGSAAAAGNGFAIAEVTGLTYQHVHISSLVATCQQGHPTLTITGTDVLRPLAPGDSIGLPGGGTLIIGATSINSDGSTSIAGLSITLPTTHGTEQITVADARCGAAS